MWCWNASVKSHFKYVLPSENLQHSLYVPEFKSTLPNAGGKKNPHYLKKKKVSILSCFVKFHIKIVFLFVSVSDVKDYDCYLSGWVWLKRGYIT